MCGRRRGAGLERNVGIGARLCDPAERSADFALHFGAVDWKCRCRIARCASGAFEILNTGVHSKLKRFFKYAFALVAVLFILGAAGAWLALKGISPLVDRQVFGNGKVVVAIFCTHSHDDHMGGTASFPNATIYLMEDSQVDENGPSTSNWNKEQRAVTSSKEKPGAASPNRIQGLRDGQTVSFGADRIQAFSVPGHTRDSAAFLAFGVLFLGDAAAGQYNGEIGGPPPFVSVDRAAGQVSLKNLAKRLASAGLTIQTLAFGHQGPVSGFEPLLRWAESN